MCSSLCETAGAALKNMIAGLWEQFFKLDIWWVARMKNLF